jgi:hypothetical protein
MPDLWCTVCMNLANDLPLPFPITPRPPAQSGLAVFQDEGRSEMANDMYLREYIHAFCGIWRKDVGKFSVPGLGSVWQAIAMSRVSARPPKGAISTYTGGTTAGIRIRALLRSINRAF